jgi:imidazolonepropionase-like amidohydrolase
MANIKLIKRLTASIAAMAVGGSLLASDIVPGQQQQQAILIQNATLHTVTQGVKKDHDLLIVNGVIRDMGPNLGVPKNARVIAARGKHVYPGLIALNTTLGLVEIEAVRSTRDMSEVGQITPEVQAHIAYNADSEIIPTVRSNGITHVEVAPVGRGLNGQSSLMQLDGWNWQDATVKPRTAMHLSWPRTGINKAFWERRSPEQQKEANEKALKQLFTTFDTIKAYAKARDADPDHPIDLRWEAMRPVLRGEMPLVVRASDYRQIEQAIHFANKNNLKLVLADTDDADLASDLIKQHNIPVIITSPWGHPSRSDQGLDHAYRLPAMLEQKGIEFALTINGSWNVRDLPFAVGHSMAYGVSPEAALRSVTLTPAKILGVDDKLGSLDIGKQANIVISSGDLFDHLTHQVELVLIEGRDVNLDNRQKRLYQKYSQKP